MWIVAFFLMVFGENESRFKTTYGREVRNKALLWRVLIWKDGSFFLGGQLDVSESMNNLFSQKKVPSRFKGAD